MEVVRLDPHSHAFTHVKSWVVLAVDLALLFHSRRTWDLCSNVLFEYWPIVQTMMLCMMHERRSCDNCFWLWHYWVVTKRHKMCQQTHTSLPNLPNLPSWTKSNQGTGLRLTGAATKGVWYNRPMIDPAITHRRCTIQCDTEWTTLIWALGTGCAVFSCLCWVSSNCGEGFNTASTCETASSKIPSSNVTIQWLIIRVKVRMLRTISFAHNKEKEGLLISIMKPKKQTKPRRNLPLKICRNLGPIHTHWDMIQLNFPSCAFCTNSSTFWLSVFSPNTLIAAHCLQYWWNLWSPL